MELFKYIVKFIYRIRWWMVIFPCIAGIIAWFLTRSLEKTYDVENHHLYRNHLRIQRRCHRYQKCHCAHE